MICGVLCGERSKLSAAAQQELACDRRSYEAELEKEKKEAADEDKNRGNG